MTDPAGARPELAELQESAQRLVVAARSAPVVVGEWPPTLVLGHLSQVDREVWLQRVEEMVEARHRGAASPSFSWWESAPGSVEATFSEHSLDDAALALAEARSALVGRLARLSDDDWAAIAHHDVFGVIDVVGLVREVLAHDREHLGGLEG